MLKYNDAVIKYLIYSTSHTRIVGNIYGYRLESLRDTGKMLWQDILNLIFDWIPTGLYNDIDMKYQ